MANTGGTYAGTGNVPLAVKEVGKQAPAKRAATQRVQRYFNKASGRMETAQAMHSYQRPAPQPAQHPSAPAGRAPAGRAPAGRPAPSRNVPFIQQTPQEIEARARAIVQSELAGNRVQFQQELGILGGEQQTATAANTAAYGKLGGVIQGQRDQQAASAKTFQNVAADAVSKAAQAAPGADETAEHLGLKPGEALPESARRQQEAARTLLSGIAQAGAAGTNERQQSEANRLAAAQTNAAQAGVETGKSIEGEFGLQRAKVLAAEQGLIAKTTGQQAALTEKLLGEQEKDRIAAAGLNLNAAKIQLQGQNYKSEAENRRAQRAGEAAKIAQGNQKLKNEARKITIDEGYKKANAAGKATKDKLDIQAKELDIGKKIKDASNKSGKPLTTSQVDTMKHEAAYVFNVFQRAKEEGRNYADVRKELEEGHSREGYVKTNSKGQPIKNSKGEVEKKSRPLTFPAVKNPLWFTVAEQSIDTGYVNAAIKQQLREQGLPDNEWSNLLYKGSGKTRPYERAPTALHSPAHTGAK